MSDLGQDISDAVAIAHAMLEEASIWEIYVIAIVASSVDCWKHRDKIKEAVEEQCNAKVWIVRSNYDEKGLFALLVEVP